MSPDPAGLLERVADLVDIPSVSRNEKAIADHVAALLAGATHLETMRLGDNVLARTSLGRASRLILAGHLDTVPPNGNETARIDGDVLWGLGSADMKGGLAVMLETVLGVTEPAVDVTFIGYVCEEIDQHFSGLRHIAEHSPEWLEADAAILGEPTSSLVEAGCQGVLRLKVRTGGVRAHSARPWMGRNAIHRLAPVLAAVAAYEGRRPVIDGCEYREALQAVRVDGGVAANVVPDAATVWVNHRFAPDRNVEEAFEGVASLLAPCLDASGGDTVTLEDSAPAAAPFLAHPLLGRLVEATGQAPKAKLGWTDVAFFSARGVPACNFGPGASTVAHSADERVERADLERALEVMVALVS
jgi:succinyl-diaminopimelate desuccinylase